MPTVTTADGAEIYYEDWGHAPPVVFSHGWPLNSDSWEARMPLSGVKRLSLHRPRPPGLRPVHSGVGGQQHGWQPQGLLLPKITTCTGSGPTAGLAESPAGSG
jgi:pimeloyl-ACP methyl ester carboxylesterase